MRPSAAFWIASALVAASFAVACWAWIILPPGAGVPVNYLGFDGHRHRAPRVGRCGSCPSSRRW